MSPFLARIVPKGDESSAVGDHIEPIHTKEACRGSAAGGQGSNHASIGKLKMLTPAVTAGMVECYHIACVRVKGADIAAFVPVTVGTGGTQIPLNGRPIVLLGINMVDLVGEEGIVLMQPAVLTAAAGAFGNQASQGLRDVGQAPAASFSRARSLRRRTKCSSCM